MGRKSPRVVAVASSHLLVSSPSKPVTPTRKRALSKIMPKTPGYEETVPHAMPGRTVAMRAIYGTAAPKPKLPALLRKDSTPKRRSVRGGVTTWADIVRKEVKVTKVAAGENSRVVAVKTVTSKRKRVASDDDVTTVRC